MAANQSRRRTDLGIALTNEGEYVPSKAFAYRPLDPDVDYTRLLRIDPAPDDNDPLICKLIDVNFKDSPKYEALSYMWGDDTDKARICLDGADFYIGKNLWDALHYMRSRGEDMPLWIDALCINQNDIPERNRQVRIMHHIYSRAHGVIVWLGKKYSKYQDKAAPETLQNQDDHPLRRTDRDRPQTSVIDQGEMTDSGTNEEKPSSGLDGSLEALIHNSERDMVQELIADAYWDRLWIIQEIGKARQIQVCFGNMAMDWNGFNEMITLHNSNCEGPLRLVRQLQKRYHGGHTLRRLLEDHQSASCKEPRDKMYGLVGLALDATGFPMDYDKSLLEVWTDTMKFMNGRGLLPRSDVIPFGRLVKKMLIGNDQGPLEQVLRPNKPQSNSTPTIDESDGQGVFQLDTYIVGCVRAIGPSTMEIIGSLSKTDQWAKQIQENFREELGEAYRENDMLMQAILGSDKDRLATTCFSHVSCVYWVGGFHNYRDCRYVPLMSQLRASASTWHRREDSMSKSPVTTGDPYLFQIINPGLGIKLPWKLGLASSQARPGDLICWTEGTKKAIVVRGEETKLQVIGTALVTEDVTSPDLYDFSQRSRWLKDDMLTIKMDASAIYVLLA